MAKILRCRDVGFDCEGVVRADSEEQVLQQAAQHAREAHGVEQMTDDIVARVRAAIREAPGTQG